MRQIGKPHQTEDERETRREQEQQAAERQAIQTLNDPKLHLVSRYRVPLPIYSLRWRAGARLLWGAAHPISTNFIAPNSWPADNRANRPDSSGIRFCHKSRTGSHLDRS